MRSLVCLIAVLLLMGAGSASCCAQDTTGPATPENAVATDQADEGTASATATEAEATDAALKRPAGTATRPQNGVKHPDLDTAWAEYDATVAKIADSLKAAIAQQFDAATAKGDLDAAEKWQAAAEQFETAGALPADSEMKGAVSEAVADQKNATEQLGKAYEAVVKALTMDKKISEAKAVRNEWQVVSTTRSAAVGNQDSSTAVKSGVAIAGSKEAAQGTASFRRYRLVATNSNPNGWDCYYRTIELFDADTSRPLTGGKPNGSGEGAANAFDDDRETKYRTVMNPGKKRDWIEYVLPRPAIVNRVRVSQYGADSNHVFEFELHGSKDGRKWTPLMRAKSVPFEFDSSDQAAHVEWLVP